MNIRNSELLVVAAMATTIILATEARATGVGTPTWMEREVTAPVCRSWFNVLPCHSDAPWVDNGGNGYTPPAKVKTPKTKKPPKDKPTTVVTVTDDWDYGPESDQERIDAGLGHLNRPDPRVTNDD